MFDFDFIFNKIVGISIGFSLGILILILDRRACPQKIEALHDFVTTMMISEMHRLIEKEQTIDEKDCY
jgi:hypothetical protein